MTPNSKYKNKTTFGKLKCKECQHKLHLGGICSRKDCGCIYPLSVRGEETITRLYDSICMKNSIAEIKGRYIPKVKIAKPKNEHKSRRKQKTRRADKPPANKKGNRFIVEHKATLRAPALGKTSKVFNGRTFQK